jgi:hypothetical protein
MATTFIALQKTYSDSIAQFRSRIRVAHAVRRSVAQKAAQQLRDARRGNKLIGCNALFGDLVALTQLGSQGLLDRTV